VSRLRARYIDERRCPGCNLFCRRIGTGGTCPHCDELVAQTELEPEKTPMSITCPCTAGGRHRADPMATGEQIS